MNSGENTESSNDLSGSNSNKPASTLSGKANTSFTIGGVKKPKFKPVAKNANSVHRITAETITTNSAMDPKVEMPDLRMEIERESLDIPLVDTKRVERTLPKREKKKTAEKDTRKKNQQRVNQLVNGAATFFATGINKKVNKPTLGSSLLFSTKVDKKVKKEENDSTGSIDEGDDHELPNEDEDPIRFPYIADIRKEQQEKEGLDWDEDEEQVSALELLKDVKDGEMMLFALPSYLPIYTGNRGHGINEETYVKAMTTKPCDYVENELQKIPSGRIGTMRVHESGRISMDINGYIVDMNVSIPIRYKQEIAAINPNEKTMTVLGDVTHRLVLTADVNNYK